MGVTWPKLKNRKKKWFEEILSIKSVMSHVFSRETQNRTVSLKDQLICMRLQSTVFIANPSDLEILPVTDKFFGACQLSTEWNGLHFVAAYGWSTLYVLQLEMHSTKKGKELDGSLKIKHNPREIIKMQIFDRTRGNWGKFPIYMYTLCSSNTDVRPYKATENL